MFQIYTGDFGDPRVINLLHLHLTRARAETANSIFMTLDLSISSQPEAS